MASTDVEATAAIRGGFNHGLLRKGEPEEVIDLMVVVKAILIMASCKRSMQFDGESVRPDIEILYRIC